MNGRPPRKARPPRGRRLASVGLVAGGLFAGAILAGTHIAGAESPSSTNTATATASNGDTDPATVNHGPDETLLTDGTANKVKAAALAEVPRIRAAIERYGDRFVHRVFTPGEREYVERKANRFQRYAARFAAKEAGM